MIKFIKAAAVAAVLGGFLFAPNAQAQCDSGPTEAAEIAQNPATGGSIYGEQSSDTGGTIGTSGDSGYIEATGDAESGGTVQGSTGGDELHGSVTVSDSPSICVNDNNAP